jgi:hypothetical protein
MMIKAVSAKPPLPGCISYGGTNIATKKQRLQALKVVCSGM